VKIKKTTLLITTSVFLGACSSMGVLDMLGVPVENEVFMDNDILVQNDAAYGITIIGFKGNYDLLYDPSDPLSLAEAGRKYPYRYIINGSYFESSRIHAGWLSMFGVQQAPLKADRQLSHMAISDISISRTSTSGTPA